MIELTLLHLWLHPARTFDVEVYATGSRESTSRYRALYRAADGSIWFAMLQVGPGGALSSCCNPRYREFTTPGLTVAGVAAVRAARAFATFVAERTTFRDPNARHVRVGGAKSAQAAGASAFTNFK